MTSGIKVKEAGSTMEAPALGLLVSEFEEALLLKPPSGVLKSQSELPVHTIACCFGGEQCGNFAVVWALL